MKSKHEEVIEKAISLLNQECPTDYAGLMEWQKELREQIQKVIIARVGPAFNEKLASLPQATLTEKQSLCRWANAEMRRLDVAIQCPKTGEPGMLFADRGHDHAVGRFQLELIAREPSRRRPVSSPTLFAFDLVAHPQRREPLAEHWRKIASSRRTVEKEEGRS